MMRKTIQQRDVRPMPGCGCCGASGYAPAFSRRVGAVRARGMVLLFVVVLLTLLAVMGGAYLISSRIDNSQVSPSDRGGVSNPFGLSAADRVDQVMNKAQDATKRKLFLDSFAYNGIVPTNAGAFPSARRDLGDESGDGDINNGVGDGVGDLIWRPTEAVRQTIMPVPAVAPNAAELGVFPPMAGFFPFTATRGMYEFSAIPTANTVHFPYYHVDALGGTDSHLASRLPIFDNFTPGRLADDFVWPWITGPIVGVPDFPVDNLFIDPINNGIRVNFDLGATAGPGFDADRQRANLIPTTFGPMGYPPPPEVANLTTPVDPEFYNDRLRTWPALLGAFDFDQDPGTPPVAAPFVAADADGDGVADSGLVPIVFDESFPVGDFRRYNDPQTGFVYLVGIRIVDNNAAINLNTALTRFGDPVLPPNSAPFDLATANYETAFTTVPPGLGMGPNRGIYLSNIGLYELFDPAAGGASGASRSAQFQRMLPTQLGEPTTMLVSNDAATGRTDIQQATLGELLAMNRDRLLDHPPIGLFPKTADGNINLTPFRSADEDMSLLYNGGGWLPPVNAPTRLENTASDALRVAAGNYSPNTKMHFGYFPLGVDMGAAGENEAMTRALWAAHFKHADPDMTTIGTFEATYGGPGALGARFGSRAWPLSPRAALVAHNGTSQAFRPYMLNATSDLTTAMLPQGMPPYAGAAADVLPPVRASANTGSFVELWRAFWNVMVEPNFLPPDITSDNQSPTYVPGERLSSVVAPGAVDPRDAKLRMFSNRGFDTRGGGLRPFPTPYQVMTLRAALSAINALDIRDVEDAHLGAGPDRIFGNGDDIPVNPGPDGRWGSADDLAQPGASRALPTAADIVLPVPPVALRPAGALAHPHNQQDATFFARVSGGEAQPFITEVMMTFLPGGLTQYLGIELYNPYPFPLTLENWYLVAAQRTPTGAINVNGALGSILNLSSTVDNDFTLAINVTIPPNSRVVLQNEPPPAPIALDANAQAEGRVYTGPSAGPGMPGGIYMPTGSGRIQSAGGQIDREIFLMRPLYRTDPLVPFPPVPMSATDLIAGWVPADSFDPTGADPNSVIPPPGTDPLRWRYARSNDDPRSWKFVSHGAYQAPGGGSAGTAGFVPVSLATIGALGGPDTDLDVSASYGPIRSLPWGPVLAGPLSVDDSSGSVQKPLYPYGGFARDGDALGVPYFGAYLVFRDMPIGAGDGIYTPGVDELLDMVAPTLDAHFADTADVTVSPVTTHVGRFVPQGREDANNDGVLDPTEDINGNGIMENYVLSGAASDHGYNWAADFFEYITTLHAPGKDLAPHSDTRYVDTTPANLDNALLVNPGMIPTQDLDPATTDPLVISPLFDSPPAPLNNDGLTTANDYLEAFAPVEGQINLNTADFGILKLLPLAIVADTTTTPPASIIDTARISGTNPGDPTTGLAGLIYLGLQGPPPPLGVAPSMRPYRSPFFLNGLGQTGPLLNFQDLEPNATQTPGERRRVAGDVTGMDHGLPWLYPDIGENVAYNDSDALLLSPYTPSYEDHTLQLTRISNLTTLRSDSYTVYIVVQAWENFGFDATTTLPDRPARMIRQERTAFVVDRSGVLPFNPVTNLPWTPADVNGDAWRDALKITPIPAK